MGTNGSGGFAAGETDIADLGGAVRAELARWGVPGIAVGVLRDGEMTVLGVGTANVETGAPVAPGTLFQIGSITKVFVATLVMRLVGAGKLALDAPLTTYLPGLRLVEAELSDRLTFRHLLTHTSGLLGDHFPDEGMGDDALARAVAGMADLAQITPPDAGWSYCNSGFYLAGRAIEVVTSQPFETAMREQVLAPLGLTRSVFFAHEAILHAPASGHHPGDPGPTIARPYPLARCSNAAGGVISAVADLLRFAAFHMSDGTVAGEPVLSPDSLRQMQTPQVRVNDELEWGLGWSLGWADGVRTIGHSGATNGFQSQLTVVPERGYAIALLTNSSRGGAAARGIAHWALAHDLGLRHHEPERVTLSAAALRRFAGTYRQPLATATITPSDGGLRMAVTARNPFSGESVERPLADLAPIGDQAFVVTVGEGEGTRVDFFSAGDDPTAPPQMARIGSRLSLRDAE